MSRSFVIISEKNHKENETFLFYVQLDGNETQLTQLSSILERADYDELYGGDFSEVHIHLETRLPEELVDGIINTHRKMSIYNYYNMFTKCTGTFKCPFDESVNDKDAYEIARNVDEIFYSAKIEEMFRALRIN